jgi:purine-binding chemotaxis protein CheW
MSGPQQYLTFTLGDEMFGVGTGDVKEIIEYGNITAIPMMPLSIRGVINLRGAVVPVIDLAARFGGQRTEITRRTCIVILEVEHEEARQEIGVVVDTVCEVLEMSGADIEPPPAFGSAMRADFILGMGKAGAKFVILLNVGKVLSVDELSMLAAMAGQQEADEEEVA